MNYTISKSGQLGGMLQLSFSNSDRVKVGTSPASWQLDARKMTVSAKTTAGAIDQDSFALELALLSESPDEIYVYGGFALALAGLGNIGNDTLGGGGGSFVAGVPNLGAISDGHVQKLVQTSYGPKVNYDVGFRLPIPWDGTQANCVGSWWARWSIMP